MKVKYIETSLRKFNDINQFEKVLFFLEKFIEYKEKHYQIIEKIAQKFKITNTQGILIIAALDLIQREAEDYIYNEKFNFKKSFAKIITFLLDIENDKNPDFNLLKDQKTIIKTITKLYNSYLPQEIIFYNEKNILFIIDAIKIFIDTKIIICNTEESEISILEYKTEKLIDNQRYKEIKLDNFQEIFIDNFQQKKNAKPKANFHKTRYEEIEMEDYQEVFLLDDGKDEESLAHYKNIIKYYQDVSNPENNQIEYKKNKDREINECLNFLIDNENDPNCKRIIYEIKSYLAEYGFKNITFLEAKHDESSKIFIKEILENFNIPELLSMKKLSLHTNYTHNMDIIGKTLETILEEEEEDLCGTICSNMQ